MTSERRTYHPKRHLRNEIYSLALILVAPVGVIAVFPYASLSFVPAGIADEGIVPVRHSFCSFISLTDEQADAAVQAARSAIKTAHEGISALRADLSMSAIPAEHDSVADLTERHGIAPMGDAPYDVLPLPPSNAAPQPERIIHDPDADKPPLAFPRDEMLEINDLGI